ncbi:uncharacterized protein METZ01_LOCUS433916, partial [marine metagenome]
MPDCFTGLPLIIDSLTPRINLWVPHTIYAQTESFSLVSGLLSRQTGVTMPTMSGGSSMRKALFHLINP